jgi:GNAT superfamily N-acetyltransferase
MEAILRLERAAAAHWRGTEEAWLGDWLLRAADGFTGRANSALPLGDPGRPGSPGAAIDAVTRWYRARGLPPMISVPAPLDGDGDAPALDAELARRGWSLRAGPAFVMTADGPASAGTSRSQAGLPPGLAFRADRAPDDAWLAAYRYRGQQDPPPVVRTLLTSAADQRFLSIRTAGGVAAIARLSFAEGWAGITAVEVTPGRRQSGLGRALTREAFAQAAAHGLGQVFLQVEADNTAARRLYEQAGFRYSHRYHYRLAPP